MRPGCAQDAPKVPQGAWAASSMRPGCVQDAPRLPRMRPARAQDAPCMRPACARRHHASRVACSADGRFVSTKLSFRLQIALWPLRGARRHPESGLVVLRGAFLTRAIRHAPRMRPGCAQGAPRVPQGAQDAPSMRPGCVQDAPRVPRMRSACAQDAPSMRPGCPGCAQPRLVLLVPGHKGRDTPRSVPGMRSVRPACAHSLPVYAQPAPSICKAGAQFYRAAAEMALVSFGFGAISGSRSFA